MSVSQRDHEESTILVRGRQLSMRRRGSTEFASRGHGSALAIIATSKANELVLVEEHKPALKSRVLDLPNGWVPADDEPVSDSHLMAIARRRLASCTGYLASSWRQEFVGPAAPAVCDEMVTWFRARSLERVGRSQSMMEIDPSVLVHYVTRDSFDGFLTARRSEGVIVDPRIYTAAWIAWNS
ncbi:MAG: hypothetical protein PF961_21255 [Planctomycetota bacterium]|nr:hypothetical protein [Planctomycetota bacterium]